MIGFLFELKGLRLYRSSYILGRIYWEIGIAFGTRVVIVFSCHSVHSQDPMPLSM